MNNLDKDMLNDVRAMAEDGDSFGDVTCIYDIETFKEEWEFLLKEGQLPESWRELWNGEEHSDEDVSEGSVYEEESESSDDDEEYDNNTEEAIEENYEQEDDDLPVVDTEEAETFKKGVDIFASVTAMRTFYPLFIKAMCDGNCSSVSFFLEKQYSNRGQFLSPEHLNILIFFMAPLGIDLNEDVCLLILEYVQRDAMSLYTDVMKWMLCKNIIFYTTFKKDDNVYFSGYHFDETTTLQSVMFPLNYAIPQEISDAFGLKQKMLQNDWTKLLPRCDEAVKSILCCTPHVVQLFIMMIMFAKMKDEKAMQLLHSLKTSSIPTMTFLALVGYLLHKYFYCELKPFIPVGVRHCKREDIIGKKRRSRREQVRVILRLLNGKRVGCNMWPESESIGFNGVMKILKRDMLSEKINKRLGMSKRELDTMFPWKDDAFDWSSFEFGFYNQNCDYSRYNPLEVSLKKGDGLFLTMVEVPKANVLICDFQGWIGPCSRELPRHPQDKCVRDIVPERLHRGLTSDLLKLHMYELPKQNDMFCLKFPKKKLRCFVDGMRNVVAPHYFKNYMQQLALDTLKKFDADGNFVYFSNSNEHIHICYILVMLRMFLENDGGLAKKSDAYCLRTFLFKLKYEYENHLQDKDVYDDVRVSTTTKTFLSETVTSMLPPEMSKMINMQTEYGTGDVVGTPLQHMSYFVTTVFEYKRTVAYCDRIWKIPTFSAAYRFYAVPKYKRIVLLGKNNLKRIGWLKQNQNVKEEDKYAGETVLFAIEDGKPKVNGKRVSSWVQFLRCLRFMKAKKSVPQISGHVYNENYLQKPFNPVYWLRHDGSIMVKLMALNENSTLLKKRTRSLKEWARRFLGSDADNSDDDDDTEAPNRQIKHLKLLEEARKTEEAKTTKNKL